MSDASYHTAEGMSNGAACSSTIGYHDKCDWVQFSKAGPVITALTSKPVTPHLSVHTKPTSQ
jgi:hypothetical protein